MSLENGIDKLLEELGIDKLKKKFKHCCFKSQRPGSSINGLNKKQHKLRPDLVEQRRKMYGHNKRLYAIDSEDHYNEFDI